VADSGGKPLALATIWLVPADTSALSRGALTDTAGAFAFERLAAGRYYLRVDRVGFQSEWSDAKPLAAGQHMALAVTSAPPPIVLGRIRASGTCRTGADMAADTPLATVWGEARKAAAARRLFDLSYRYGVDLRERLVRYAVPSYTSRDARHQLTSTPTAARVLAEKGSWGGYGVGMDSTRLVAVQEMLQILTEPFARTHCLYALEDHRGQRRIHFQPLADAAAVTDVAGTIILDARYGLSRIEFEYRKFDMATSRGYVEFGDGGLKGGPVRFLAKLVVWVFVAPASRGDDVSIGWGSHGFWGKEQARAWARYGPFVRDTAAP
jgi:hypothetical protein